MKKWDFIIVIALVLIAGIWFFIYQFCFSTPGAYAVVYQSGNEIGRYSLKEDIKVEISGEWKGINILEIKDGFADIIDADCKDELCVHQKKISKNGETLVCLPHKMLVKIIGSKKSEFDAISQ